LGYKKGTDSLLLILIVQVQQNLLHLSLSINLSTGWQTKKKEGIFCQNESQTVRGYGKCSFWQKASNRLENSIFSRRFLRFYYR